MDKRPRHRVRLVGLVLLALGLWQLGEATWLDAKAWLAQMLLERAWAAQAGGVAPPPWPWADTRPVARLSVPAHGLERIVLAGGHGRSLAFGPARLDGFEATGVTVLSGHRDTHFAFLEWIEPGTEISLETVNGPRLRYRVTDTAVVDSRNALILPTAGEPALALVTCWPFDAVSPGTPWRYVVSARADPR